MQNHHIRVLNHLGEDLVLKEKLSALLEDFGQDDVHPLGVVTLGEEPTFIDFQKWLQQGMHANMDWIRRYQNCRKDPSHIYDGAQTALLFGWSYHQGDTRQIDVPKVAQYARMKDYHKILKRKGEQLATLLRQGGHEAQVLVDTAPVLEKALTASAGFGFVGRNTLYIHPKYGSWLLLMSVVVNQSLMEWKIKPVDSAVRSPRGGCGSCRRCETHCPTGALANYTLDARKCLAYYSIEHRDTVPLRYWRFFSEYIFGCDICQLVCPYNRGVALAAVPTRQIPNLYDMATMDQIFYEKSFGGTPMTRAKRVGLIRNALIAMTVTGHDQLSEAIAHCKVCEKDSVLLATLEQIDIYKKTSHFWN
ncbi:MAG: tRNA epoxyqueuosine(34) reductase QueG [Oligoflexales bacterium]